MFLPILLICAIDVVPQDCNPLTALDSLHGVAQQTLTDCLKGGQTMLAGTVLGPRINEYPKIVCKREESDAS